MTNPNENGRPDFRQPRDLRDCGKPISTSAPMTTGRYPSGAQTRADKVSIFPGLVHRRALPDAVY